MRLIPAIAALLLFVPSCHAFTELFEGFDPAWAQAQEAMRQHKLEEARRKRAEGPRLKPLGDVFKPHRVPKQDPACVWTVVSGWLRVDPGPKAPGVYYASRTLLEDFAAWEIAEYGGSIPYPKTIKTEYLPSGHVLFLDDEGVSYDSSRTIDDVMAGQLAKAAALKAGQTLQPEQVQGVELTFNSAYSSKNRSACK